MIRDALWVCTLTLLSACSEGEPPREALPVSFTFQLDFWALVDADAEEPRTALTTRHVLPSGSEIGLTLDPGPGRVYIAFQDARGALEVLYPGKDQPDPRPGPVAVLPPGARLNDEAGLERFYLVAAREPLVGLEEAIAAFHAGAPGADEALIAEITALRDQHEELETAAPRPVTIGGQVRGKPTAREYTVQGVLCRTITLDHR